MHVNLLDWLYNVVIWAKNGVVEVFIEPFGLVECDWGDFWDGVVKRGLEVEWMHVHYGCPRAYLGLYVLILYWDEEERGDYS